MLFGSLPKAVQENVQHKLDEVSRWWSDLFLNDWVIHCKLATLIHLSMFSKTCEKNAWRRGMRKLSVGKRSKRFAVKFVPCLGLIANV